MKEQLTRIAPGHFTASNLDRYLDGIAQVINQSRRRMPRRFRSEVIVISASSLLKTPSDQRYNVSHHIDELTNARLLVLDFDGNKYRLPAHIEPVLNAMCSSGSFRLEELPGDSDMEAIIAFAIFLQDIGFLSSVRKSAN